MQFKILFLTINLLVIICSNSISAEGFYKSDSIDKTQIRKVYYKVDQGFSSSRILDMSMSNLHYTGPGGLIKFGRWVFAPGYISEWNFLRINFNYLEPAHGATGVYKPTLGLRYMHLRDLDYLGAFHVYAGLQGNLFADIRVAPRLGNSFLFADLIGEVRPKARFSTNFNLLRQWNIDLSITATLIGLGIRFPQYGTSFKLAQDGGSALNSSQLQILKPLNFRHFTTSIFLKEYFGDEFNPNYFRIGYVWDYYTMKGHHGLDVNNAVHQLVLEFYFRVN